MTDVLDTLEVGGVSYDVVIVGTEDLGPVFDVQEEAGEAYRKHKDAKTKPGAREELEARFEERLCIASIQLAVRRDGEQLDDDDCRKLMIRAAYEGDCVWNVSKLASACQHACGLGSFKARLGKAVTELNFTAAPSTATEPTSTSPES